MRRRRKGHPYRGAVKILRVQDRPIARRCPPAAAVLRQVRHGTPAPRVCRLGQAHRAESRRPQARSLDMTISRSARRGFLETGARQVKVLFAGRSDALASRVPAGRKSSCAVHRRSPAASFTHCIIRVESGRDLKRSAGHMGEENYGRVACEAPVTNAAHCRSRMDAVLRGLRG